MFPRLAHRWLAYAVALQVVIWVVGGVLFAWLPFQPWVKAEDFVRKPEQALPADWAAALASSAAVSPVGAVQAVTSAVGPDGPLWKLRLASGATIWLRADGRAWQATDAAAVERFARALYRGSGRVVGGAERFAEIPVRLGLVRETGGRGDLWRVSFDDAQRTRLYFDGRSGEFVTARTEAWVWYDLLWRLHIMDYRGGEDFNNGLLRAAAPLALLLALAGVALAVQALLRSRRRRTTMRPQQVADPS